MWSMWFLDRCLELSGYGLKPQIVEFLDFCEHKARWSLSHPQIVTKAKDGSFIDDYRPPSSSWGPKGIACSNLRLFAGCIYWAVNTNCCIPSEPLVDLGCSTLRQAYKWLRDNTPEDARVMAWWDYGYQIAGIANRTTIADGNTWSLEQKDLHESSGCGKLPLYYIGTRWNKVW